MSSCPECTTSVPVAEQAQVTSIVVCPLCEVELEVVGVQPVTLALAPELEEDFGE